MTTQQRQIASSTRPSNGWANQTKPLRGSTLSPVYGASYIQPTVLTAGVVPYIFLFLLTLLSMTGPAWSQTPPASAPPVIQLDDLVQEALKTNSAIQASRSRQEAAATRPSQVSTLPDPTVTFTQMSDGTPIPFGNLGKEPFSWYGISAAQPIPFPGKLSLQGQYASQEAAALEQEAETTALQVVAQVKQAYYDLYLMDRSLDIIAKDKDLLERFEQIAETKYAVGQGHQENVLRAQLELSLLTERLTVLEQQRGSAIAQLNRLLNRSPDTPLPGKTAPVTPIVFQYTLEDLLREATTRSPQLRARQFMVDRESVGLNLARRAYYPDFTAMYTYLHRPTFTDMWEIKVDVQFPLYFWRKQRLGVNEAAATLEAARQEYQTAVQELFFKIKDEYLMVNATKRLIDLYGNVVVPQATLATESALAGYQVGSVDFLTLLNDFTVLLNYELRYHEQVIAYHKALARLEELAGLTLLK